MLQAVKSAVAWPIQVKLEPFTTVDMTKIPAFQNSDHGTGEIHRCTVDEEDIELFSRWWAVRFCDSEHTFDDFGM